MPQPGRGEVEGRLAIRKGSHDPGPAPDLPHDPLERVVGLQFDPMLVRESIEAEGLLNMGLHQLGRLDELPGLQLTNNLRGFPGCGGAALLGVDGFQHVGDRAHFARGYVAEDVAIEVHHTELPLGLRIELGHALDQTEAGVRDLRPRRAPAVLSKFAKFFASTPWP